MQPVDVEQALRHPPPAGIDIGSLVEVRTLDGERMTFRVTGISESGLDGKYGLITYEDMARLKVEKPEEKNGKAGSYIISALGFVALIALINSADEVRVCSSPPCE